MTPRIEVWFIDVIRGRSLRDQITNTMYNDYWLRNNKLGGP
jgi:hypothetical protein